MLKDNEFGQFNHPQIFVAKRQNPKSYKHREWMWEAYQQIKQEKQEKENGKENSEN